MISVTEREREHNRQMNEQLKEMGICSFGYGRGDIQFGKPVIGIVSPKNDISDYKIVYSECKYPESGGFIGNQPKAGTRITSGGYLYYTEGGGPSISFSASFGKPYGSVSFSVAIGQQSSTGVGVSIPSTGYWKIYATKKYEVRSYVIYRRTYVDDFTGYVWKEYSGGYTKVLYQSTYKPIKVSK